MKKIAVLSLLLITLLIFGCQQTGDGVAQTPYIGGSNGLIQSFINGAPPDEIFDDSQLEFSIITQLENVGESDITEGYVKIHGILGEDFGVSQSDLKKDIPELRGAKKNTDQTVTTGDIDSVEFKDLKFVGSVPGTLTVGPIRVEACYDYKTSITSQLCVRERLTTEEGRELCEPSGVKEVANSGGPIHVTNLVEQPLSKGKIQITFQIESAGQPKDRFYKFGTDCDDDQTNRDRYRVYIDVKPVSGVVPDCQFEEQESQNSGYKTLWDGRPQTVSCILDFGDVETSFKPFISMDLKYRYSQYIEKTLLVKDITVEDD